MQSVRVPLRFDYSRGGIRISYSRIQIDTRRVSRKFVRRSDKSVLSDLYRTIVQSLRVPKRQVGIDMILAKVVVSIYIIFNGECTS